MEKTIWWILRGFESVNDLQSSLVYTPGHDAKTLSDWLGEIVRRFAKANEHLNNAISSTGERQTVDGTHLMEIADQENPPHRQLMLQGGDKTASAMGGSCKRASSSSQTPRPRQEEEEREIVLASAPTGNTELPPEDNYTWRKYGQKEINGKRFPRAYYRCTYQKLCNCAAKKQVQRLDDDPFTYRITYRGRHTCSLPRTSPSGAGPSSSSTLVRDEKEVPGRYLFPEICDATFHSAGTSTQVPGTTTDFILPFDFHNHEHQTEEGDNANRHNNES